MKDRVRGRWHKLEPQLQGQQAEQNGGNQVDTLPRERGDWKQNQLK